MADDVDWDQTTFDGNRRRQQREWMALTFRGKVQALEEMEKAGARLRVVRESPARDVRE